MNTIDFLPDVLEQPTLLAAMLNQHMRQDSLLTEAVSAIRQQPPRRILMTGMGSSLFASYGPALRLLAAGWPVTWIELSELLHYAGDALGEDTLLVVVSQSGETIEAVRLLEQQHASPRLLAITNNASSTLARRATWAIPTGAGRELTVATKTYSTALLVLILLSEQLAGTSQTQLQAELEQAIAASEQVCVTAPALVAALGDPWYRPTAISLVGRGPAYATALSGALVIKETAKQATEALSSAQFRHGPLEIAGPGHMAIVCAQASPTLDYDRKLASELRRHGSSVLWLGPQPDDGDHIVLPHGPYGALYGLIPLQLYARELAIRYGIAPGSFRFIGKVTSEE